MSALATQEQLDHYDATVEKHVRGEATLEEVWAADPYDGALREMARRYFANRSCEQPQLPHPLRVREENSMGNFLKRITLEGIIAGFVLGALFVSVIGHIRPPA